VILKKNEKVYKHKKQIKLKYHWIAKQTPWVWLDESYPIPSIQLFITNSRV